MHNTSLGTTDPIKSLKQLVRYGLVGFFSNTLGYLIYLLVTFLGVEPKIAMSLVYVVGAFVGFIGNRNWTFAHRGESAGTALRFVLAHFLGFLLNFLILYTFVDRLGYTHQWVQAVAIVVVAGFLFFVIKFFVFRKKYCTPEQI